MTKKRRGDGEGSVFKHGATGKWRAQLPHYRNGKRHFTTKSFATKGAADAWLTSNRHDRYQGVAVAPDKMTLAALMDSWLALQIHFKVKTRRTHSDFIELHIKPGIGHIPVQNLDTMALKRWLISLRPKLSHCTVLHIRDTLRQALKAAVKEFKLIKSNPILDLKMPPAPRKTEKQKKAERPMTPGEAKALLTAIEQHRDGCLFHIMLSLGLRKGEAIALKLGDFDQATNMLHIQRALQEVGGTLYEDVPKTELSDRALPLSPVLVARLNTHLELRDKLKRKNAHWQEMGYIFTSAVGTPIYPRNVNRTFDAILKAAELRHFKVQDLRHASATFGLADGATASSVASMLGHSSPKLVFERYGKRPLDAGVVKAASALDRLVTD